MKEIYYYSSPSFLGEEAEQMIMIIIKINKINKIQEICTLSFLL
jgi:hypothetical protein